MVAHDPYLSRLAQESHWITYVHGRRDSVSVSDRAGELGVRRLGSRENGRGTAPNFVPTLGGKRSQVVVEGECRITRNEWRAKLT
jgi:hypothetical protein